MKKGSYEKAKRIAELIEDPRKATVDEDYLTSSAAARFASEKFLEKATLAASKALADKIDEIIDSGSATPNQLLELAKQSAELRIVLKWDRNFKNGHGGIPPVTDPSLNRLIDKVEKNVRKKKGSKKEGPGYSGRSRLVNRENLKPPADLPKFN